ncbi:MAG: aminopeptidase N [Acidimicrobiales bacterium]|nr:aminopeptidase N [Hyphomonadaceae bacterium]RZV44915.1 MAG: aminopeptidase N [Acidimicrobiales bacterium]
MKTDTPVVTRLKDYKAPEFLTKTVDLKFELDPTKTIVTSTCHIQRSGEHTKDLRLDGEDIELVNISIDGKPLAKSQYSTTKSGLTIKNPPKEFTLQIVNTCNPSKNTSLMGLYVSGGRFCTQCEAQGFRRITYFQDQPDILSTYKVRIEANKQAYPTLLANGNCVEEGDLENGRHFAEWEDPFPKPCYLFALVAGEFDNINDSFVTMSGRTIPLDIYVDPGDASRAEYAMDALKRSMKWDEDVFGREYDLDRFMIVAVRDFNFGAMENKGLNIFNSSLLLADEASATDHNFESIESVVAHEYFHNWTGNRITCRDWFQLCLKEGFTVFRDQEFSADQRGRALQRIKDVKALRAHQFVEDAGPLAHPVRPASYMKIDNFYTATVYNKGAELIRMLKNILGAEQFRAGCDLYFDSLDGTAATVEDFIDCFEKSSGQDLSQFMRWYEQAGTPEVSVTTTHDAQQKSFRLHLAQKTPATAGQPSKQPFAMPVDIGLLDRKTEREISRKNVILKDRSASFEFSDVPDDPVVSVFRQFSAPVNVNIDVPASDRLVQMKSDPDLFNRWEAGQALARDLLVDLTQAIESGRVPKKTDFLGMYVGAIGDIIRNPEIDNGFKSMAVTPPADDAVLQAMKGQPTDPLAIRQAIKLLRRAIAEHHFDAISALYSDLSNPVDFSPDAAGAGRRALRNTCLALLATLPGQQIAPLAREQLQAATNMTEEIAALLVLTRMGGHHAQHALSHFYDKWHGNPLVVDKWFAANAQIGGRQAIAHVRKMTEHEDYKNGNPNRIRALIGGFAAGNLENFHRLDGEGYRFVADNIIEIDRRNPQVAARLAGVFGIWSKVDNRRAILIQDELRRILKAKPSANVMEIATKSLGD